MGKVMIGIAFDTHAAALQFKSAGFTEDQVEVLVDGTRRTTALPDISTLAIKNDVEGLACDIGGTENRLQVKIAEVRTEIAGVKNELGKWVVGAVGVPTLALLRRSSP